MGYVTGLKYRIEMFISDICQYRIHLIFMFRGLGTQQKNHFPTILIVIYLGKTVHTKCHWVFHALYGSLMHRYMANSNY